MAGVSRATVSRVVNGSPRVSPDVRSDVQAAIDRLGYVPNRAARSLVTRRSDSIAVVITEPTGRLFSDPFFPRLLRGISTELAARDRQLILLMPESAADEARTADYLTAGHVDGAVLVSLHEDDPLPGASRARPGCRSCSSDGRSKDVTVELCRRRQPAGRPDCRRAPDQAVDGGSSPPSPARRTWRPGSIACAAIATGSPRPASRRTRSLQAIGDFTQESGAAAMKRLLAARPDIDAVFAASDLMAAGALTVLAAAGRRVPADVAVVGFDDSPVATSTTPQLTSVAQPIEAMGREVARLLVDAVEASDLVPRRVILATDLVRRASSAGRPAP